MAGTDPQTQKSQRSDEDLLLLGSPRDVEKGPTPGAVAKLRAELRPIASKELPECANQIRVLQRGLEAALATQQIYRESANELADAIERLEQR